MQESLERNMMFLKDTELQNYIEYRTTFEPEEVLAAIKEYQRRGRVFTEAELDNIKKDLKKLTPEQIEAKNKIFTGFAGWRQDIIRDPQVDAPIFYARIVVYLFSLLFSVLFGAVLMAMNIRRTERTEGYREVIAFGAFITGLELLFVAFYPMAAAFVFFINVACSFLLCTYFWNKHIGNHTRYKARSFWLPLLAGIGIYVLLIALLVNFYYLSINRG